MIWRLVWLLVLGSLLTACASTQFRPWVGDPVGVGAGGTREVVDGIDIWVYGSPPVRFVILGIIEDTRRQSPMGMIGFHKTLAAVAKTHGGDAVILADKSAMQRGTYKTPTTTTTFNSGYQLTQGGNTVNLVDQTTVWIVVRYLEGI